MASVPRPRQTGQPLHGSDRVDLPTPQVGTPSKTRLANIPKQAVEKASKSLKKLISPDDDDEEIQQYLHLVLACVQHVLKQDPKLKEQVAIEEEFRDNVKRKGEKIFFDSLRAMVTNSDTRGSKAWEDLFEDEVFLKETPAPGVRPLDVPTSAQQAAELAWRRAFEGNAANVLLLSISSYLDKKRDSYSRQATIVNSSGTGKSRMADELATKIITVPMCLRPDRSTGYPPSDTALRDWLLSGNISDDTLVTVRKKLHGFVYALLIVTRTSLAAIDSESEIGKMIETADGVERRQAELAAALRDRMTVGQSYKGPNDYRKGFYEKVTQLANEFMEGSQQIPDTTDTGQPRELHPYVSKAGVGIKNAGKQLAGFVDPAHLLGSAEGLPRRPLVILAFDEAHILTDSPPITNRTTRWNLFSELRRILRQTSDQAIFSLFLSTAGRFNLFSPEIASDPSRRIQDSSLSTLDPITEISFDDLAYHAPENKIMLEQVVDLDWMCHLGRPLFASIYDAEEKQFRVEGDIMDLVKSKLLDGPNTLGNNPSGSLACLSVRFALEFNMDGTAGHIARTQVERHMRLCLAATARRDTLVTLAGSEPLLAEAAYELMKGTQSNPVHHLANHSDLNCVDRGRRGELVAALLIMRACDAARGVMSDQRWVPVDVFMEELLSSANYHILRESFPTFYSDEEKNVKFTATFKDYGIWFNHVIKVDSDRMFSADHLWKFITRGAMILCSNNQEGIDIVIPICHTQKTLSRDSVTAILVQVKNSTKYQSKIQKLLFDRMDPIHLGLFPNGMDPKPVVRIVFALAAVDAAVAFPEARQLRHHQDKFTAFDVWCAGLGHETFKHIDDDLGSYQRLLERSLRPHDAFEVLDDEKGHIETRRSRGSLRRRMAPLTMDDDAHHGIHLRKSKSAA